MVRLLDRRLEESVTDGVAAGHPGSLHGAGEVPLREASDHGVDPVPDPLGVGPERLPRGRMPVLVVEECAELRVPARDDVDQPHFVDIEDVDQGAKERLVADLSISSDLLPGETGETPDETIEHRSIVGQQFARKVHRRRACAGH